MKVVSCGSIHNREVSFFSASTIYSANISKYLLRLDIIYMRVLASERHCRFASSGSVGR